MGTILDKAAKLLERELPDLRIRRKGSRFELRWSRGRALLSDDDAPRRRLSSKERRHRIATGQSFFDPSSGLLHLNAAGAYVHLVLPRTPSRLTAFESALAAALCENHLGKKTIVLPSTGTELQQLIETLTMAPVTAMTVSRFLRHVTMVGVVVETAGRRVLHVPDTLQLLPGVFRLSKLGPALRFPVEDSGTAELLVKRHHPSCIHGLSGFLARHGVFVEPKDIVASKDILPAIRRELGAALRPSYRGPSVEVRVSQRVPMTALAGVHDRHVLSPVLAAVECLAGVGAVREAGETLWRRWTR